MIINGRFTMIETYKLWEDKTTNATIIFYPSQKQTEKSTVVILPGGAYEFCDMKKEGEDLARYFNNLGISAFVVEYSVFPNHFPKPLQDARQAVRFVRENARKFNIDEDKVAVIGSSAGGHLAALLCTYRGKIEGESTDSIDYLPNAQILCYPVISGDETISHQGSFQNLLGGRYLEREAFSPELIADEKTPQAFIWHTAEDGVVNVTNSYRYAERLRNLSVPCEMHIFPYGEHGLGLSPQNPHVAQWGELLKNWLCLIGWIK